MFAVLWFRFSAKHSPLHFLRVPLLLLLGLYPWWLTMKLQLMVSW